MTSFFLNYIVSFLMSYIFYSPPAQGNENFTPTINSNCLVREEIRYIRGNSMSELFVPEQAITVQTGYYACHPVERGQIILVKRPGRPDPIIKIISVIPEDHFKLKPVIGGYELLVNDKPLRTPKGHTYIFPEGKSKMLRLYQDSFKGKMPAGTYFVFGTETAGSLDSSRFGPITLAEIIARVK